MSPSVWQRSARVGVTLAILTSILGCSAQVQTSARDAAPTDASSPVVVQPIRGDAARSSDGDVHLDEEALAAQGSPLVYEMTLTVRRAGPQRRREPPPREMSTRFHVERRAPFEGPAGWVVAPAVGNLLAILTRREATPEHLSRLILPPVPEDLGQDPVERRWTIPGAGLTATTDDPDLEIVERLVPGASTDGGLRPLTIEQRIVHGTMGEVRLEIEGNVDVGHGRWTDIQTTMHLEIDPSRSRAPLASEVPQPPREAEDSRSARMDGRWTLRFDPERTASRLETRRHLAAAEAEPYVLVDEVARFPFDDVIDRALANLAEARGSHVPFDLVYMLRAHPARTWKRGISNADRALRGAFLRRVALRASSEPLHPGVPSMLGELLSEPSPPDDLVAVVAGLPEPALRSRLERLAASSDGPIAQRATMTLRELEAQDPAVAAARFRAAADDEEAIARLGVIVTRRVRDPRPLVPVLIDMLEGAGATTRLTIVAVLESLTVRNHAADVSAWRRFWSRNRALEYDEWLTASAAEGAPTYRALATRRLGLRRRHGLGASDARVASTVAANLEHPHHEVRFAAMQSLAMLGDLRALAPLAAMLDHPDAEVRTAAIEARGFLRGTPMGYEPRGPEVDRARARRFLTPTPTPTPTPRASEPR